MNPKTLVNSVREDSSAKRVAFVRNSELSFNLYAVEFCDACGAQCMRDDGPSYHAPDRAAVNRISMMADHIGELAVISACDALGGQAVCPDCYTDADPNEQTQPVAAPASLLSVAGMPREFADEINRALRQTGRNSIAAWFVEASGMNKG